ncbi:PREDICTED: transient receptor potential-gamma protein-like [Branchiostoma belcheri]|uniref:Transient receptor potential-gamma protein-like n=1 Tax=Branchiostoma belcheri TaxID=7741 RepID=A0A6P4YVB2_BRABE|nr:PREDICTED: transient receptor potential-gamma protein-like [Branchiostoma belcheri]
MDWDDGFRGSHVRRPVRPPRAADQDSLGRGSVTSSSLRFGPKEGFVWSPGNDDMESIYGDTRDSGPQNPQGWPGRHPPSVQGPPPVPSTAPYQAPAPTPSQPVPQPDDLPPVDYESVDETNADPKPPRYERPLRPKTALGRKPSRGTPKKKAPESIASTKDDDIDNRSIDSTFSDIPDTASNKRAKILQNLGVPVRVVNEENLPDLHRQGDSDDEKDNKQGGKKDDKKTEEDDKKSEKEEDDKNDDDTDAPLDRQQFLPLVQTGGAGPPTGAPSGTYAALPEASPSNMPLDNLPQPDYADPTEIMLKPYTSLPDNVQDTDIKDPKGQFLFAVQNGDVEKTRALLERNAVRHEFDINTSDDVGRTAIELAVCNQHEDVVELLLYFNVNLGNSLLFAVDRSNCRLVERLIRYTKSTSNTGPPMSPKDSTFPPEVTPLVLAAQRNDYKVMRLLLFHHYTITPPPALIGQRVLIQTSTRLNILRALCSPYYISLTSADPFQTAFGLTGELNEMMQLDPQHAHEYRALADQCGDFAADLLGQVQDVDELVTVMSGEDWSKDREGAKGLCMQTMQLAASNNQIRFVNKDVSQGLLLSMWAEKVKWWNRAPLLVQLLFGLLVSAVCPLLIIVYRMEAKSYVGEFIATPVTRYICEIGLRLWFIVLLMLATFRVDSSEATLLDTLNRQSRASPPSIAEWILLVWIAGMVIQMCTNLWRYGARRHLASVWGVVEMVLLFLLVTIVGLRGLSYGRYQFLDYNVLPSWERFRIHWDPFSPALVAEALMGPCIILSVIRMIPFGILNRHIGPFLMALKDLVRNILMLALLYFLVLFSFAWALYYLYWYYTTGHEITCTEGADYHVTVNETYVNSSFTLGAVPCNTPHPFGTMENSMRALFFSGFFIIDATPLDLTLTRNGTVIGYGSLMTYGTGVSIYFLYIVLQWILALSVIGVLAGSFHKPELVVQRLVKRYVARTEPYDGNVGGVLSKLDQVNRSTRRTEAALLRGYFGGNRPVAVNNNNNNYHNNNNRQSSGVINNRNNDIPEEDYDHLLRRSGDSTAM